MLVSCGFDRNEKVGEIRTEESRIMSNGLMNELAMHCLFRDITTETRELESER